MKAPLLAWITLSVNLIVILQGAVVRATGSGAGCGRDWPRCQGEILPLEHGLATWIEYSHRALSGVALLFGIWLLVKAVRLRHELPGFLPFAIISAIFLLFEALIGAGAVLTGLTGDNASVARGLLVAFHLLNSMLLVGALALATVHAYPGRTWPPVWTGQTGLKILISVSLLGMMILMFSGGIAAMGNTMFPPGIPARRIDRRLQSPGPSAYSPADPASIFGYRSRRLSLDEPRANGLAQAHASGPPFPQSAPGSLRRATTGRDNQSGHAGPDSAPASASCTGRSGLRSMVRGRLVDSQLSSDRQRPAIITLASERDPTFMINTVSTLPAATWRDYLTLTKPKVISLLLFTAVCPMFMAARGLPPWLPLLGVLVGGYMATGGAGVFNMVLDRDIDGKMRRTANRPLVTGVVSVRNAVVFGLLLSAGAFLILWLTANLLTALLAWFGLLFYVIVYTAWLKRSTWQNIVIGGVAGSVMPLLGWAAVTNGLDWIAGLLFVLIFLWTPVHFWALAFLVKDQYEAVGIPMAPAILGSKGTLQQMLIYAALTTLASLAPLALNEAGWLYSAVVLLLDFLLISKVVKLYRQVDVGQEVNRKEALSLYKYSMLYLALLFLTLVADRTLTLPIPI